MTRKKKSRYNATPVDMSLPAEERGRKKTVKKIGGTPQAQLSHGLSPKARKRAREGEKRMTR